MPQITAGSSKNPMAPRMAALAIGSSQATDGSAAGVSGSTGTGIYMDVDEDEDEDEEIPVPLLATTGKYVSFCYKLHLSNFLLTVTQKKAAVINVTAENEMSMEELKQLLVSENICVFFLESFL
jgi:hypothetical protein